MQFRDARTSGGPDLPGRDVRTSGGPDLPGRDVRTSGGPDLPGRENAAAGTRGKRAAGAIAFFAIAVLLLTAVGLLLTGHQVEGWVLVFDGDARAGSAGEPGGYVKVPFGLLTEWQHARKEPPPAVAELDGKSVELHGLARAVSRERTGGASGLWLVTDPVALGRDWEPVVGRSVWAEFPKGKSADRPIETGAFVRARGVLRVGLAEIQGVGPVAFRLELRRLWLRWPRSDGGDNRRRDGRDHHDTDDHDDRRDR